jgi:hypothetical protein
VVRTVDASPVHITNGDGYNLTVNRVMERDTNVVISFDTDQHRDAIGLSPDQALKMAEALVRAARVIDGV